MSLGDAQIAGLSVSGFASWRDCAEHVLAAIKEGRGGMAVAINAEKVVAYRDNPALKDSLATATLRYPDGAGAVLAMWLKGVRTRRIPGVDLWLEILRAAPSGTRVALIGAKPEVLKSTAERLEKEFAQIDICLMRDGYEGARDTDALAASVVQAAPGLVYVAMGSPLQEQVMAKLRRAHPAGYYIGLGGSFDVYVGKKPRAPMWMRRTGLEWLYRFYAEPTRAGRKINYWRFFLLLATGRF